MASICKMTWRTIRTFFGRFMALLLIVALSAGLFAGLKVTADAMIETGETYFAEQNFYDFRLFSTLGFISDDVERFAEKSIHSVNLLSFKEGDNIEAFWDFHNGDEAITAPNIDEAIISPQIAEKLSLSVGDALEIRNADMKTGTVKIAAIFDNHIYDYIVISERAYTELFGEWQATLALISTDSDTDYLAKELIDLEVIASVSQLSAVEANISDALNCLSYIIWIVVFFSGALAFVVIYNLTNINIAERSREIATVQALGFYPKETESYVLKENLILSVVASILGLPLGKLFHAAVISMVKIDMITFNDCVRPISYLFVFIITVLFAVIVNRFIKKQAR